jgi:trypsin
MSINNTSIEEGIIGTTDADVHQAPAASSSSSWLGRKRSFKMFVSVAVMFMAVAVIAIALSTGKRRVKAKEANSSLIVGGTKAIEGFPYMVAFRNSAGEHACGGSLIAKDVVLIAAHCYDLNEAILGLHTDVEVIGVKSILPHPDFDGNTTDVDFMLVFLEHAFTASNVEVVTLNSDPTFPLDGQEVTVMGWGSNQYYYGYNSDLLRKANMNIISNEECDASQGTWTFGFESYNNRITNDMMCATSRTSGGAPCDGDSGGPSIVSGGSAGADVQVGIISWSVDCASDTFPSVFARVSNKYNWIVFEVCKGSLYASESGFDCSPIASNPTFSPTDVETVWVDVANRPTYMPTDYVTWLGPGRVYGGCLKAACKEQWKATGVGNFYMGSYADYGCFHKGDNYYWGEGATSDDQINVEPSGQKERVKCGCYGDNCYYDENVKFDDALV